MGDNTAGMSSQETIAESRKVKPSGGLRMLFSRDKRKAEDTTLHNTPTHS